MLNHTKTPFRGFLFFFSSNCPSFLASALARATSDEVLQSDLSAHFLPKHVDNADGIIRKCHLKELGQDFWCRNIPYRCKKVNGELSTTPDRAGGLIYQSKLSQLWNHSFKCSFMAVSDGPESLSQHFIQCGSAGKCQLSSLILGAKSNICGKR